jgi:ribonuclease D
MRQSVETALELPEDLWPKIIRKPRLKSTQEHEIRLKEIRKKRDAMAQKLSLDPTLIAPKALMEQLSRNEKQAFDSLLPWQRECLSL